MKQRERRRNMNIGMHAASSCRIATMVFNMLPIALTGNMLEERNLIGPSVWGSHS